LSAPSGIADALKFGFLGAYAFVVSLLIRRFFQSDLRPSAYATVVFPTPPFPEVITIARPPMARASYSFPW